MKMSDKFAVQPLSNHGKTRRPRLTSREQRRIRSKLNGIEMNPMVTIKHDYIENNTNKRIGDFRFLDSQGGRVTPELINFFNGPNT